MHWIDGANCSGTGAYGVKLCKDGMWKCIVIDDCFPISSGHMAFSKARRGQLWVALIEKAMAKLHGSFAAIESGSMSEGLALLTGWPCVTHALSGDGFDADLVWMVLLSEVRKGASIWSRLCGGAALSIVCTHGPCHTRTED